MPERTSSGSLSMERIARTLLRNKREIDRASVTSVSRTITESDVGSSNRSRIESESNATAHPLRRRRKFA